MLTLKNFLCSLAAGTFSFGVLTAAAHAAGTGDAWDTGPGTVAHDVADANPLIGPPDPNPNGVDTGVKVGKDPLTGLPIADGVGFRLYTPGEKWSSDYIYAFGGDIWFSSDSEIGLGVPKQLLPLLPDHTHFTSVIETGDWQPAVTATTGADIFGTPFRAKSDRDPIPEPASWAIMTVGFLGLGAIVRLHRRRLASAA